MKDKRLHHAIWGSPNFRIGYFLPDNTVLRQGRWVAAIQLRHLGGAANCNEGEIDCKQFPLHFEIPCRKAGIDLAKNRKPMAMTPQNTCSPGMAEQKI
jgi:hypothetical protein